MTGKESSGFLSPAGFRTEGEGAFRGFPARRKAAAPGRGFFMKIKALEISGFKSFYRKTKIDFSAGVTAVVGPNGCGKSNILDAVKWVIGEHNPRLLRAGGMEDVISNGSAELKPLGMADVSLVLEDVEGFGFEEVRVRRKLYRSGESEYSINGVKCRLRDVTEMFLDTGMGARAYSIVEQGQVEAFITARPEERRKFIEEVAGIEKYKARRKETRSRIESTKENISRALEMKQEVSDRIESLARQAERAKRYGELTGEARSLELGIAAAKLADSGNRRSGLVEKTRRLEAGVDEARTAREEKSSALSSAREKSSVSGDALSSLEKEIYELGSAVREKEYQGASMEREIAAAARYAEDIESEIGQLRLDVEGAEEKTLLSSRRLEELGASRLGFSEDVSRKERDLELLRLKREESGRELEETGKKVSEVMTERSSLGSTVGAFSDELSELSLKKETLGEQVSDLALRKRGHEEELASFLERQDEIKREFTAAAGEKEALDSRLYDLRLERERKQGELRSLESREKDCASRMEALDRIQSNYEWLPEATRKFVVERKSRGVLGVVSDFVFVPENYERAVEAAFGEKLNWIVVEESREAVHAVELLREYSAGRGTFIPVTDELRGTGASRTADGSAPAASLNSLLEVKVIEKDLMDSMLHEVYVAADLAEALRLKKRNGNGACFATLEGDYVDSSGAITGGHASGGVFERKREIEQLGAETAALGKKIAAARAEFERLGEETENLSARCAELDELLRQYEIRSVENVKDQSNLSAKIEDLRSREESLSAELDAVEKKLGSKNRTMEEMESLLGDLDGRRAALDLRYEETEKKTLGLAEEERSLREEITKLRIEGASVLERQKALEDELAEAERRKNVIGDRLSLRRKDMELKLEEKKALAASRKAAEGESRRLRGELDSKKASLEEARAAAASRGEELLGAEREFEEASRELEVRGESLAAARAELARVEDEFGYLGERYREVFGGEPGETADAPALETPVPDAERRLKSLRARIESFGLVNLLAPEEYRQLEERESFLRAQTDDLTEALDSLESAVRKLDRESVQRFRESFDTINAKFAETFARLFEDGEARLELVDPGNLLETGIEVMIRPGAKKFQPINLLSGGEKALSAIAVVISACLVRPAPFLFFDEIDAALDEVNTARFNRILREISRESQVVVITHNKRTMREARSLVGITSDGAASSRVVSVKLDA